MCPPCPQVSWEGVTRPSRSDMVALMVPAGADLVETPPAKHKWCSSADQHLSTGAGSLTCALVPCYPLPDKRHRCKTNQRMSLLLITAAQRVLASYMAYRLPILLACALCAVLVGVLYWQNLASILPVLLLEFKPIKRPASTARNVL